MSELFDEVDEDVRRDQLKKLWDRYSIYIIAGALLIVAAVGGWRGYQYLEAQEGGRGRRGLRQGRWNCPSRTSTPRPKRPSPSSPRRAPSGYRMLARLRAAAEVASRDPQAAVKMYDDIAADRSIGALEQDLAKIRAAALLLETATYPNMQQRLEAADRAAARPFATPRANCWRCRPGAPTIPTAARQWLDMIANDGETPPGLRSRAEALQALLPPVAKS